MLHLQITTILLAIFQVASALPATCNARNHALIAACGANASSNGFEYVGVLSVELNVGKEVDETYTGFGTSRDRI